jgi:bifunctional non-homologous end joining protein LigD
MLCMKGDPKILSSDQYIFQPKLDGTRALYIDGKLMNRRGRNIRYRYPEFSKLQIEKDTIVDGEVVVYNNKGLPDFSLLQSREQTTNQLKIEILSKQHPATYVVFDCLRYMGRDLTEEPVETRLEFLIRSIHEGNNLQMIVNTEDGIGLWEKMKKMGTEGVMAKKKGSKYFSGKRSEACLKLKNLQTMDCVILGYTIGEGKRESTFGALILGVYKGGELLQVGKVGTGWSDQEIIDLKHKMDSIILEKEEDKVWLKPELVCEVEYLELTKNEDLRAPSFKHLRYDKDPKECILEV